MKEVCFVGSETEIRCVDINDGTTTFSIEDASTILETVPDRKGTNPFLVSAQENRKTLSLFDHRHKLKTKTFPTQISALAASTKYIVVGFEEGFFSVVSKKDGRTVLSHDGHVGAITRLGFSTDEKALVSCGHDGAVCLWDVSVFPSENTGDICLSKWREHTMPVSDMHVGIGVADRFRLITSSHDNTCCLLSPAAENPIGRIRFETPIASVTMDSLERIIAAGSTCGKIYLQSTENRKELNGTLSGHTDAVSAVSFSIDNTQLLSVSLDCTLSVWSLLSRERVCVVRLGSPAHSLHAAIYRRGSHSRNPPAI
ncbi:MAG: WD repeat-containing protein [Amphiamblys sp. WSBS2006]|nr:MAG: WD repeat-containing protein [Amphiamblys sp. WSBS2006]